MSLCRPTLSQVIPKYPRWKSIPKLQNVITVPKRPHISRGGVWGRETISQTAYSSLSTVQSTISSTLPQTKVKGTVTTPPPISVETYFTLRPYDKTFMATQPASNYIYILDAAVGAGAHELVDSIVLDILEVFEGTEQERFGLLQQVLCKDLRMLGHRVVSRIFEFLNEHGSIQLDEIAVEQLVQLMNSRKTFTSETIHALQRIKPTLLRLISERPVPGGIKSITYTPPNIVYATFTLLRRLLKQSKQGIALDIFQSLVGVRLIPPEAMAGLDQLSQDFNAILRVALMRACLHWHWRPLATSFLIDSLQSSPSPPHQTILDLNTDIFYELLNTPTHRDIHACEQLIRRVHPISPAPNSIIRLFYNHAYEQGLIDVAEKVYAFTRLPSILESHSYPPPQGDSLAWLMRHLTTRSKHPRLARTLALEVIEKNVPLPPLVRGPFITCVAAQGHATLARKLWERYAVGRDKSEVVGNSALMIRMVSLFNNLALKAGVSAQAKEDTSSDVPPKNEVQTPDDARSLRAFAKHVLLQYKEKHAPLATASHFALTSYARGCFMLGKYAEGLAAFRHLLRRKELPDLHDINVVLSAAAHARPALAVDIVRRMDERNLKPDAVTYSTILQCALIHENRQLVVDMLTKLKTLSGQPMSLKTLTNIIRASTHRFPEESVEEMQSKLSMVLHLVSMHPEANIASSTQTGKYLVYRSLQAQAPVLAFKFWERCLKHGADWDDNEQRALRRLIARMVQEHSEKLNPILVSSIRTQLIPRPSLTPPP